MDTKWSGVWTNNNHITAHALFSAVETQRRRGVQIEVGLKSEQTSLKLGTHNPCSRVVSTAREQGCPKWRPCSHPVSTDVTFDTRVHGPWIQPVNTGCVFYRACKLERLVANSHSRTKGGREQQTAEAAAVNESRAWFRVGPMDDHLWCLRHPMMNWY